MYLLTVALLVVACAKDSPEAGLPKATQEGRNTAGCLIDGERFMAAESGGSLLSNPTPALSGGFYEDSLYYLTLAGKTKRGNTKIHLFFRSQLPGTYFFNQTTLSLDRAGLRYTLRYAACDFSDTNESYITTVQHTGQMVLTRADLRAGISAGTFEFTAVSNLDPSKTIRVTSGRFDRRQ